MRSAIFPGDTPKKVHIQQADLIFDGVFERSLNFRVEMPYEGARQFIRRIDKYNFFDADAVLAALDSIDQLVPRRQYGEGKPSERDFTVTVGREGSPVIYIERFEFPGRERIRVGQIRRIVREMQVTGLADEADYCVEKPYSGGRLITFRFWWD